VFKTSFQSPPSRRRLQTFTADRPYLWHSSKLEEPVSAYQKQFPSIIFPNTKYRNHPSTRRNPHHQQLPLRQCETTTNPNYSKVQNSEPFYLPQSCNFHNSIYKTTVSVGQKNLHNPGQVFTLLIK
ncbi:hypothetical protein KC19_12G048400, partial [Ceratodon purpureus]